MNRTIGRLLLALSCSVLVTPSAFAQQDDAVLRPAEPDFTLVSLPTSLRLPVLKSAFRVTHRFGRPLGAGDLGDLVGDLFGLDNGAVIGLEYRIGIVPNGQIGFHRSSSGKTIEFFGQYGLLRQGDRVPIDVSALVTYEGADNLHENYSPAIGAIVSRTFGDIAAVYAEPIWVNNTNTLPGELADDNDTFMVGLGARVRIRPTIYLAGELAPRASGYKPGVTHGSFAIEKRAGGHIFQLNFSNSFATTMGQLARGGSNNDDWFLGFNISRKFF
ncbi:MAG: hypothetical protein GEU82_12010 [Luteitalea sp.]|nr:hypothetical protein [Luteitalea sp.]